MRSDELEKFQRDCANWTDSYLAYQLSSGPEAFRDVEAWKIIEAEVRRRSLTEAQLEQLVVDWEREEEEDLRQRFDGRDDLPADLRTPGAFYVYRLIKRMGCLILLCLACLTVMVTQM